MVIKVLKIEGMSCEHCQKAVTQALEEIDGVKSATVDVRAGVATVSYDPGQTGEAAMKAAVEEAGYAVVPG